MSSPPELLLSGSRTGEKTLFSAGLGVLTGVAALRIEGAVVVFRTSRAGDPAEDPAFAWARPGDDTTLMANGRRVAFVVVPNGSVALTEVEATILPLDSTPVLSFFWRSQGIRIEGSEREIKLT